MLKSIFLVALLLASTNVIAAKLNPYDCPCYDPYWLDEAALTYCTAATSFDKQVSKKGVYWKDFSWVRDSGEYCVEISINKSDPTNNIQPRACQLVSGGGSNGFCIRQVVNTGGENLTEAQMKACEAAFRDIKAYINSRPNC